MEIDDFYADQTGATPVPVAEQDTLTPFGQNLGVMNSTWSKYNPSPPDPSLFNIQGIADCPMSDGCDSEKLQLHRLKRKRFNSWAHYQQRSNMERV